LRPAARAHEVDVGADDVTISVLTHNGAEKLRLCLESIFLQSIAPSEVVVVDNGSTDETASTLGEFSERLRVVSTEKNLGCSGGRNVQLSSARTRYLFIVDDDARLHARCLAELLNAIRVIPDAALIAPRVLFFNDPQTVQFDGGGRIHYLGEAILETANLPGKAAAPDVIPLDFQGGVAFLADRNQLSAEDAYDEDFFFGRTDGEFSFRMRLRGKKLVCYPRAIVYHDVKQRGFRYVELQIINRWTMILKTYERRTLVLILPALLLYELMLVVFLAKRGQLRPYRSAVRKLFHEREAIRRKRRRIISHRLVGDRAALSAGRINIREDVAGNPTVLRMLRISTRGFDAYWRVVSRLLKPG
jgi:hypothetical protein